MFCTHTLIFTANAISENLVGILKPHALSLPAFCGDRIRSGKPAALFGCLNPAAGDLSAVRNMCLTALYCTGTLNKMTKVGLARLGLTESFDQRQREAIPAFGAHSL
jgi:hypothetical protein